MAKANDTNTDTTDTTDTAEERLAHAIAKHLIDTGFFGEMAQQGIHVVDDDAPAEGDEGEGDEGNDDEPAKGGVPAKGATNGSARSASTGKGR